MSDKAEDVHILNFDGEIEYIGKFSDFDEAEDFLHGQGKIANWIFFEESYNTMLDSIETAKQQKEGEK